MIGRRPRGKRASYREAIEWIAFNDDVDIGEGPYGYILTIMFAADLWGKEPETVARAVMAKRKRAGIG